MPNSLGVLVQETLDLIGRAFASIGTMLGQIFTTFLWISPLPDEVDFFLFFFIVIAIILFFINLFRGKN